MWLLQVTDFVPRYHTGFRGQLWNWPYLPGLSQPASRDLHAKLLSEKKKQILT